MSCQPYQGLGNEESFTAEAVTGEEVKGIGLVNEVAPRNEFMSFTRKTAIEIA